MQNYSEGLRSLFAYTTFGLLTVAGGAIWTAHANLNARTDAAVAMVQDLVLAMQDAKLNLTELHLTNLINSKSNGLPTIPPSPPHLEETKALKSGLLTALNSLRKAEGDLSAGKYWLADDHVKDGFQALGAPAPNLTIDELKLDKFLWFRIQIPREATVLGWAALATALLTVATSLDVDGQGGGYLRRRFAKTPPGAGPGPRQSSR